MKSLATKVLLMIFSMIGIFANASGSIARIKECKTPLPYSPTQEWPVGSGMVECTQPGIFDCCVRNEGNRDVFYKRVTPNS